MIDSILTLVFLLYFSEKMKYLDGNRVVRLGTQTITNNETMKTTTIPTQNNAKKGRKKQEIICDVDGCRRQFKNASALRNHQRDKHSSIQTTIDDTATLLNDTSDSQTSNKEQRNKCKIDEYKKRCREKTALQQHQLIENENVQANKHDSVTTTTFTTDNPEKAEKQERKKCGINNCQQSFRKRRALLQHQISTHSIPLRCLLTQECFDSNEIYIGKSDLQNHFILQHADSFPQHICPIPECKNSETWLDCLSLLRHFLLKHTSYLLKYAPLYYHS
jgi:hypothetical protein